MESVTHREMRNQSAALLRRVAAGETIIVTNHGLPAAVIGPAPRNPLDDVLERGEGRAALRDLASLGDIRRRRGSKPSAKLIEDSRGRW